MPYDAFISYASKDHEFAHAICRGLEGRGVKCWIAPRDVPAGSSYGQEIMNGIRGSSTFVLLLSTSSVGSAQVEREVERASFYEKRIIPINLDTDDPGPALEYYVAGRQRCAYSGEPFLETLAALVRGAPPPASAADPTSRTDVGSTSPTRRDGVESPGIYICYLRGDTDDAAGRLHDTLAAAFGADVVAMQLELDDPEIDLQTLIEQRIAKFKAVLVLIGRTWATAFQVGELQGSPVQKGLIRMEVTAAFQRGLRVIPVLVQGASMPRLDDLPDDMQPLAYRNAIELSPSRWRDDVACLIEAIKRITTTSP